MIKLITDAVSDLSREDELRYGIQVIPFQVALGELSIVPRVDCSNEEFYALMDQHDEIPKTAQVNPFQFQEIYQEQAAAGVTDLILVLINSHGSATHGNAVLAAQQFREENPQCAMNIHVFDGRGYSSLYGAPVVRAAQMLEDNAPLEAVLNYLEQELPRREIYFGMYTLRYAAKSGRIPSAAAFLGDKLNLKPIMRIFENEIVTAAKCRGENKLISKVVEMSLADMEPGSPYELIYGSDHAPAEEAEKLMTEALGYPPAAHYQIGAAIAANAGHKIIGISFTKKANG